MKIQVLKSCAGLDFAYYEGEIADCRDSVAKDLISAGYAKTDNSQGYTACNNCSCCNSTAYYGTGNNSSCNYTAEQ